MALEEVLSFRIMEPAEEQEPVVRLRNRPLSDSNGAQTAVQRGLEALHENSEDVDGKPNGADVQLLVASAS
ncbi:unnamed protein product [Heligmosomoides polygyrus]|uniref:Kinesin motor domain-containing protein n=1 Tax=Heligmosomoides polygyrus TaxID=6339 RepID=A0A183G3V2_HELPZ|nr:unnamed protein product [Heligmosomoides polygyrus]